MFAFNTEFLKNTLILIFCFFITLPLSAQHNEFPEIRWIKEFPVSSIQSSQKNIFKKITEIVVGKKEAVKLIKPISVLATNPDTFLVLDQGYGALFQVENKILSIPHNLHKKFSDFSSLVGLCYTKNKEILFTDSRLNHIYKISKDKKELKIFNDTLILQQPTGIAYSSKTNEIWVVETSAHHIRILNEKGQTKKIIGQRGTKEGEFNFPTFLTFDPSGIAYVVDAMNFRIQLFDSEGNYLNEFGEAGDANGYFSRPKGIASDSFGNIYVVDALLHGVQVFNKEGQLLYRFGTQGQGKEEFWMPGGIYIDSNNYIYIADTYNARIQVFQLFFKQ